MTEDWSAAAYLRFEDERTRPAADLLAHVAVRAPALVVDHGCGPGNSTELLARRYPDAEIVGADSSPDMLAAARRRLPHARFVAGDVAHWAPDRPADLLFANAVLQWLPDHATLLPHLMSGHASSCSMSTRQPARGEPRTLMVATKPE